MAAPRSAIVPFYLRLAPGDIALVKFLFESYEEVGIVRTVDRHEAIIVVLVMRDFLAAATAILDEVRATIACTDVAQPPAEGDDWLMREIEEES
jgi:uncharacterized protein DUF4911